MELILKKPLALFDLETTGLSVSNDRLIEISILKVTPEGKEEQRTWRVNPGMPIPDDSRRFHGITDEDVAHAPLFKEIGHEVSQFLQGCDLAGYNVLKFDLPMLVEEFLRHDIPFDISNRSLIDVQTIFMKMEPRTLKGAYRFFCEKELSDAHSAEADTRATYEVLKSQLSRYENADYEDVDGNISQPVVNDMKALHTFSSHHHNADLNGQIIFNDNEQETFNFGKHKGKTVEEVFTNEPAYYNWMMKGDFPLFTKRLITTIKLRMQGKQVSMTVKK